MGAEAVMALIDATETSESCVITLDGNQMLRLSLVDCVRKTKEVTKVRKYLSVCQLIDVHFEC